MFQGRLYENAEEFHASALPIAHLDGAKAENKAWRGLYSSDTGQKETYIGFVTGAASGNADKAQVRPCRAYGHCAAAAVWYRHQPLPS
jgi:hypothetical protein